MTKEMIQNIILNGKDKDHKIMANRPIILGNSSSGDKIYFQSQIHSNETHSTPVLFNFIKKKKKIKINGQIIIWPCVNNKGFYNYCVTKNGLFDNDNGQNWNRIDFDYIYPIVNFFKNRSDHIISVSDIEMLINKFSINIIERQYGINKHIYNFFEPIKIALKCKYFIDVHTPEFGVEHLYCNTVTSLVNAFEVNPVIIDDTNNNTFRKFMMKLFNCLSEIRNKHFVNYFSNREIITIELPSNRLIDNEYISFWTKKLMSVLGKCNFININNIKTIFYNKISNINALKYYYSKLDGIIILAVPIGTIVEEDSLIMTIISINGIRQSVKAVKRGMFLCSRDKKSILKGEWIARVLEF